MMNEKDSRGQILENNFDKIFKKIERIMDKKESAKKKKTKKVVEKVISRQMKKIDDVNKQQVKNRQAMDKILKSKSKVIFKNWKSDLIENKRMADKLKVDTKKLHSLLHKIPDHTTENKTSWLHNHFMNSRGHVIRSHRKKLKTAFRNLRQGKENTVGGNNTSTSEKSTSQ